jgi:hypothetical protein
MAAVEKAREQLIQAGIARDPINPPHYNGTECMQAIEAAGLGREFCLGNVIKYVWRAKSKEDLEKARWYLDRVIGKS